MKTFKAVAERLSFHRAAEELYYAQSSVSAQIASLEQELGVRLFERLGKRILLTDAGADLYGYACKILDLSEAARAELTDKTAISGTITVRVPESVCVHRLPPAIARFRARLPGVGLGFITCAQEGLQRDLRKGLTDIAFLLADTIQASDLEVEMLFSEKLVLVASPHHALATRTRVSTEDLKPETLLLTRVDCSYRRILENMLAGLGGKSGMVIEFHSVEAALACAAAGLGLTMVPEIAARDRLTRGELIEPAWTETGLEVAVLMIWHRDKWLTPALKAFMNTVRETLAGL